MFNNKKGPQASYDAMPPGKADTTIIGSGSKFDGTLNTNGIVRVDGIFSGELHVEGNIIIGENGYIKGNIKSDKITIAGKVEGNIVFLYHDLFNDNKQEVEDLKDRYRKGTVGDVEVKQKLASAINRFLYPFRERYTQYNNPEYLDKLIDEGSLKVREIVQETLKEIKEAMGFNS
jgi:hypothetical protein